jgi:ribonuclease D
MTEALACIKDSTVLAIDLEYFIDKTTNQNVICTLQLSCVYRDIVIDCLKLPFRMIRSCIEPFFHDASITKVLHGCEQDLIILKSNFNLSLVNSVDTARIEMALTDKIEMPGLKMVAAKYLHGLDMDK